MRSAEELQRDQDRLAICAELEAALESVQRTFPGMTIREAAAQLPANTATKVLQWIDELEIQSREYRAVEVKR